LSSDLGHGIIDELFIQVHNWFSTLGHELSLQPLNLQVGFEELGADCLHAVSKIGRMVTLHSNHLVLIRKLGLPLQLRYKKDIKRAKPTQYSTLEENLEWIRLITCMS
jgi:hypothetical protein